MEYTILELGCCQRRIIRFFFVLFVGKKVVYLHALKIIASFQAAICFMFNAPIAVAGCF